MIGGFSSYRLIIEDKFDISDYAEFVSIEDSLDEIAVRLTAQLSVPDNFLVVRPGQLISLYDSAYGENRQANLFDRGVIWDCEASQSGVQRLKITAYDKTIYLARSEDEYLWPAGQTAATRLRRYASDWSIPVGTLPDTGIPLEKAVYRVRSIYSMIQADLYETVRKGGLMFRPQMEGDRLVLRQLGDNKRVWSMEKNTNLTEATRSATLEQAVTQVKIVSGNKVSEVVSGETEKYGTLQKVVSLESASSVSEAKKAAERMLTGVEETIQLSGIDINTLRAGDRVMYEGLSLFIVNVRHEMGEPGMMSLELANEATIRRRYYSNE